jgi:hypothetical protein
VTTFASALTVVHAFVASIPSLIVLATTFAPLQTKTPIPPSVVVLMSAFWAGGAAFHDASLIATTAFILSFSMVGYCCGKYLEACRRQAAQAASIGEPGAFRPPSPRTT